MLAFTVRRLLQMVAVLFTISVVTFAIFQVVPGGGSEGATLRIAGRSSTEVTREQVRRDFGLDDSLPVQYARMMGQTLSGELTSYTDRTNVRDEIVRGLPATLSLVIGAALIWVALGIAMGVVSALHAGRWPDRAVRALSMLSISMPVFWLGAMLLYLLSFRAGVLPAGGYVGLTENPLRWAEHMLLPWLTLAALLAGFYARLVRANVLEQLGSEHVRAARARGVDERRVVTGHALRGALTPLVALLGLDLGVAIGGGAILTEAVFDLRGVGQYAADAVGALDLPPIMGTTLYAAFVIVAIAALADIVQAWLDPRVRRA